MKRAAKMLGLAALGLLVPGVVLCAAGTALNGDWEAAASRNWLGGHFRWWGDEAVVIVTGSDDSCGTLTEGTGAGRTTLTGQGSLYLPAGVESARRLEISADTGAVVLRQGDAYQVEDTSQGGLKVESRMDGDTWKLEVSKRRFSGGGSLVVTLPSDQTFERVRVSADAGAVSGSGVNCREFEAEADAGSVELEDVTAETMKLSADAGAVTITGTVTQKAELSSDVGAVELYTDEPEEYGYRVRNDLGAVELFGEKMNGMDVQRERLVDGAPLFVLESDVGSVKVAAR